VIAGKDALLRGQGRDGGDAFGCLEYGRGPSARLHSMEDARNIVKLDMGTDVFGRQGEPAAYAPRGRRVQRQGWVVVGAVGPGICRTGLAYSAAAVGNIPAPHLLSPPSARHK
jgi:hypothetical protein